MRASHRAPISVRSAPVAAPRPPLHTHAYRTAHHEPPARTQDKKTTQDAAPGPKYTLTDGFGVQVRWPAATPHATPQPSPTSHHCAHTVANHPSPPPTRRCPTCRSNRTCPAESQASSARASARPPRGSWCAPLTIPDSHAFLEPKSLKVRARALSLRLHLKESPTLGLTLTQDQEVATLCAIHVRLHPFAANTMPGMFGGRESVQVSLKRASLQKKKTEDQLKKEKEAQVREHRS